MIKNRAQNEPIPEMIKKSHLVSKKMFQTYWRWRFIPGGNVNEIHYAKKFEIHRENAEDISRFPGIFTKELDSVNLWYGALMKIKNSLTV
jgi:hypothetical protein